MSVGVPSPSRRGTYPLADQFYGERGGRPRDPFGQQWMLSQRMERVSREEMDRRAASFFGSS